MKYDFGGKVAYVTGGTSGIGEAAVKAFASSGARVAFTGRRDEEGKRIAEEIGKEGGEAFFFRCDVRNPEEIAESVRATVDKYGRLDFAFNNAGVEQFFKPLTEQKLEYFDFIFETNVRAVWLAMQEEIPHLLETGGAIVNTSSIFGLVASSMIPLYVASKHAVIGLTKSVALEYAKKGIRVNAVVPAAIETPMIGRFVQDEQTSEFLKSLHPLGRLGKPEEVANAVLWLCSEQSSFVTGSVLTVDGGYTAQ
ncbi:MAG: glucose 1-dehydrogenase [Pyrinomonadaceae bacterium]